MDLSLTQFHQNFFLGPANQVLAGDAMLVDVISQYGVGSIYFLGRLRSRLARISNGTLGLLEGLLSALMYVGTYATLRLAGCPARGGRGDGRRGHGAGYGSSTRSGGCCSTEPSGTACRWA